MATDDLLQAGLTAARAGDRNRAVALFAQVVQTNPASELGWWYLGLCVTDPKQQTFCFQRVLALNPNHAEAKHRLARLTNQQTSQPAGPQPTAPVASAAPPSLTPPPLPVQSASTVRAAASPPGSPEAQTVSPPAPRPPAQPANTRSIGPSSAIQKGLLAALGVLVGLTLCGVPLIYLVASGQFNRLLPIALAGRAFTSVPAASTPVPATPTPLATLPATWTPVPTPTPRPTHTPRPSPTESLELRLAAAQSNIAQAQSLTDAEQYAEAIPVWNDVIAQVPDYAEAHYQRARCYLHLTVNQRFEDEYIAYVEQSLADMNQALHLDPTNGDYYHERHWIYTDLAGVELYRVDQDYWNNLALLDAQAALKYNTTIPGADRDVAFRLLDVGRPQEALDLFQQFPPWDGQTVETDVELQEGLTSSYMGLGQLQEALKHIDQVIAIDPGTLDYRTRAVILYSLGRKDEALQQLNATIKGKPFYCGCRYYLRALVYYRLGKPDLALADIDLGTGQTWERGGVRSYVLGLLALDAGDRASAADLLVEAEASLPHAYGPVILQQIQSDMAELGLTPLAPTPYAPLIATPFLPIGVSTPTP